MAEQLFPTFEIPTTAVSAQRDAEMEFRPSPLFDYDTGDFVRDGANRVVMVDGREAFRVWVRKIVSTQINSCLAYWGTGIDAENAMQAPSRAASESILERSISEALLANTCTERVYGFQFTWEPDSVHVHFTVQPKAWAAFDIDQNVV